MIAALAGLLLPIGAAFVVLLATGVRTRRESALITLALAIGLGVGVSSLVTFWAATIGVAIDARFARIDALGWFAILAAASIAYARVRRDRSLPDPEPRPRLTATNWLVRAAFAAVAMMAIATAVAQYRAAPHGQWDAWAIWNQKARFIVRDVRFWTDMLTIGWSNPGHPFLVSLSVARLWAYARAELTIVPAILGGLWGIGVVAAVIGALGTRNARAWIAGSLVVAPAFFTDLASAQTADLAVGLFIVATLAWLRPLLVSDDAAGDTRVLLGAGIICGCTAWTKNEGLLFVGLVTALVAWASLRHRRPGELAWWLAGVAPVLATVLWFKLVMAPVPPEYMSEREAEITLMASLFDPARHALIGSVAGPHWLKWGGPNAAGLLPLTMVAAVIAAARPAGRSARLILTVVVPMLVAYYAVWLVSPLDTAWLVRTTFDRLLIQLWPSLVLAAFSTDNR